VISSEEKSDLYITRVAPAHAASLHVAAAPRHVSGSERCYK
jgi:hypothetical protein